jgi:hypothetical protein
MFDVGRSALLFCDTVKQVVLLAGRNNNWALIDSGLVLDLPLSPSNGHHR